MGTKPFKIGGEMVEKNEHEVGNPPLKMEQISAVQCSEFLPVLEWGSFFSAISPPILKGLVPIW